MPYSISDTLAVLSKTLERNSSCVILSLKIDVLPLEPLLSQRKASIKLRDVFRMSKG